MYSCDNLSLNSSQTKAVQNIKTHSIFNIFHPENHAVYETL